MPSPPTTSRSLPVNETHQGSYGDCTVIAAINDLVNNNPDWLAHHVVYAGSSIGHQIYNVSLYENGQWHTYSVNTGSLPGNGAKDGNGHVNVGSVIENAVAQAHGGYNGINNGARPDDTVRELTGSSNTQSAFSGNTACLEAVIAGHTGTVNLAYGQQEGYYNTQTGSYDGKTQKPGDVYIHSQHEYSVRHADSTSGSAGVTVENPWNQGGNGGGSFTMTADAFNEIFGQATWGSV